MNNIITLKNYGYQAKINLSRGANLISFGMNGESVLREPCYEKDLDNPFLYGMPILFPVNRISGGKFEFEGREYVFPINEEKTNCHLHGTLHQTPFQIKFLSSSRAVCLYEADSFNKYLNFPHDFKIEIEYKIVKKGIKIKTTVYNSSTQNMPIFLGYHTTFNIDENSFVKAEINTEYEREMVNYLPTGKTLDFDEISNSLNNGNLQTNSLKLSRHYKAKNCGKMAIFDKNKNQTTVYNNSKNLPFRLIYSDGLGYICLEPQTCLANCQNSPFLRSESGFLYVKPNRKVIYKSQIFILKGDRR